ncbi:hypothetical protein AYI69_g3743, partial [Smittium culicis]
MAGFIRVTAEIHDFIVKRERDSSATEVGESKVYWAVRQFKLIEIFRCSSPDISMSI